MREGGADGVLGTGGRASPAAKRGRATNACDGRLMSEEEITVETFEFVVSHPPTRGRIDAYLASRFPDYSRTFIKKLIEEGGITVDGRAVKPSHALQVGAHVAVRVPMMRGGGLEPENIALEIIYEDDWILVVNKPPDMVVHPAKGHLAGTLVNAAAYHCQQLSGQGGPLRPGVVHRLDRDTSGVILLVKDESVHQRLAHQFLSRKTKKEYLAICEGRIELDGDVVDAPIGRHARAKDKMAVRHDEGKTARTTYEVVERLGEFSVVRCFPESGRTHQIRVHMHHIGHPIVCDSLYGVRDAIYMSDLTGAEHQPSEEPILERQALHARRLTIWHPVLKRLMCFEAKVPDDMVALARALRAAVAQ